MPKPRAPSPTRLIAAGAAAWACLCSPPAWTQTSQATSGTPAPAPASTALLNHLVSALEARERPSTGPLGTLTAPSAMDTFTVERQLRGLGARAAPVAPRVAGLLAQTSKNASELAWTLWSISPAASTVDVTGTGALLASDAPLAERLLALASQAQTRQPEALPLLRQAAADPAPAMRLLATVALAYQREERASDQPALLLASLLSDSEREVRSAAANSLRLQGPRAIVAGPALMDYFRRRENVYQAAQALAALPTPQLLPLVPDLEAVLADSRWSTYQKEPVVSLMLRVESHRAAQPAPVAPAASPPAAPKRPAADGQPGTPI